MSEVNLKDYLARLDSLLSDNSADEVIHHSRHILRTYAKNVETYRYLGQALVLIGRLDEAKVALQGVLSVLPDDFVAHVTLGEVNDRQNRCDDAIWHLERALDQRPNEKVILDALRVLYHRCRQTGTLKIQMTAGAVARQHLRTGSPERAVETLRSALKQVPDRIDLQLLLAQILWQIGRHEEAADVALEILTQQPDCLEANKIMAQLWLSFDRPSDAQRYVNRVESIDPYLAVELVRGTAPDDDAFRLDELDYQRSAQSEVVATRLDWLQEVTGNDSSPETPKSSTPTSPKSDWTSSILASRTTGTGLLNAQSTTKPADEMDWMADVTAPSTSQPQVNTDDLFSSIASDNNTDDLAALFGDSLEDDFVPSQAASAVDADDPFAWARQSGIDVADSSDAGFPNLFGLDDEERTLPEQPNDPFAWMNQYDQDMLVNQQDRSGSFMSSDPEIPADGSSLFDDDLFAEFSDNDPFPTQISRPAAFDLASITSTSTSETANAEEDVLDWLRNDALNTDDSFAAPSSASASSRFDIDMTDVSPTETPVSAPLGQRGLTAILNDANLDWLRSGDKSNDIAAGEEDTDDWLNQFEPVDKSRSSDANTCLLYTSPSPRD